MTPHKGKFRIRCSRFSSTQNRVPSGTERTSGYLTEEAANADFLLWEFALLKDGGARWNSFSQRTGDDHFAFYREEYEA